MNISAYRNGDYTIAVSDKLNYASVFVRSSTLLRDIKKNGITISVDLGYTYLGSKQTNTYIDIERLGERWSIFSPGRPSLSPL